MKQKLQESLCLRSVMITTDIWTSSATHAHITTTVNHISDEWIIKVMCRAPVEWLNDILE